MKRVTVRIYAELNDHLPKRKRRESIWSFEGTAKVRRLLASLRIPEDEVDLVLLNGRSVDFDEPLADGDRVSLFPIFESFDISNLVKVRDEPLLAKRSGSKRSEKKRREDDR